MVQTGARGARRAADAVLIGGPILVLDERGTRAEGVALADGRIAAVGDRATIEAHVGERTEVVELGGRAVIPGINDSHLHGLWLGARWPSFFFDESGVRPQEGVARPLVETRADRRAAILRAGRLLSELGITSYTEPGMGPGEDGGETGCFHSDGIEAYRELAAEGALQQRVTLLALHGVLDGPSDLATVLGGIERHAEFASGSDPSWLNVPGIKLFGDLIPLSRQAWTERSYDDGSHGGLLVAGGTIKERAAHLAEMIRAAHLAGLQIGIHATGDRTIGLALDAIASAEREPGAPSAAELAHVVIHGDLATREQVARMAELGVFLNAQAGIAHLTCDWLAARLGDEAAADAWQFGAALEAGNLVLSSDSPVLDFDWRAGIARADARIVAGGGATDERSRARRLHGLLRAYTAVPAAQDRAADWKGTIEVGKVADIAILERDPFLAGAAALAGVAVERTIVGGRTVFER